ncbi:YitT family protein [Bacillus mycoides]|uniref:YitT family protein n=1 Tax=Bacillus mycoides TaxID=1405 RepID=UPI0026CD6D06
MKRVFEYVLLTIGSIIVAGSLELILAPNGLVDGGVTAIAIMANKVAQAVEKAFSTAYFCV